MQCDFCGDLNPYHEYHTDALIQTVVAGDNAVDMGMSPEWAACEECSRLIDNNDFHGLLERNTSRFYMSNPEYALEAAKTPDVAIGCHTAVVDLYRKLQEAGLRKIR